MPADRSDPVDVVVVIAAYNAARFLEVCLRSVLAQTCTNLQAVVVDDGSTDDTAKVAASLHDDRLVLLSRPNGGPSYARNIGIAAACPSRYVAFIDADDEWDATKLARQIALLDAEPAIVAAGCFMRYISARGRALGSTGQLVGADDARRVARGELLPFHLSSLMVRTPALGAAGGFDEFLGTQGSEDLEFYARLARIGPVQCLPMVLGSVRLHAASAMALRRPQINRAARFVRLRLAARDQGRDLPWSEFLASHPATWRERRQDLVEQLYRAAALSYADEQSLRALGCGVMATLVDPVYTLRRAYRQRLSPSVRAKLRERSAVSDEIES